MASASSDDRGERPRRVLVLGGYGMIGSYVLARLHAAGFQVSAIGREISQAQRRFPYARWVAGDLRAMLATADWRPALADIDAVVNCAGALQEGGRDSLQTVHVAAMAAMLGACRDAGIRRVIQVSAIGIGPDSDTDFARTKRDAEAVLQQTDLDWLILRPALVLAPVAYGGTAMLRGLAGIPFVTPVIEPDCRVQVVAVEDVAETVLRALDPAMRARRIWELMHPEAHRLAEIVGAYRAWLGWAPRPVVAVPPALGSLVASTADLLGRLGWRSPARTTAQRQLAADVIGDPTGWISDLGLQPKSLAQILAAHPAGVQERWFARLYFLKPFGLAVLGLFWLFSGLIALGPGRESAIAVLTVSGVGDSAAQTVVALGASVDIVIGIAVAFRRFMPWALASMVAVSALYLIGGTFLRPDLWLDPLGVYLKIVPAGLAALLMLAVSDER